MYSGQYDCSQTNNSVNIKDHLFINIQQYTAKPPEMTPPLNDEYLFSCYVLTKRN